MSFSMRTALLRMMRNISSKEERWFCIGQVGDRILTVRFTYRHDTIRIFGAGCWRKWSKYYEEENSQHG